MSELGRAGLAVWAMTLGIMVVEMAEVEFPWEALATLIAGTAAVIGAVFIGKKQTRISEGQNAILREQAGIASRQVGILQNQVDLERLALRGDLFDKRFAVFEATEAWLADVMNGRELTGADITKRFKHSRDQAKFLFDHATNERLKELSDKSFQYYSKRKVNDQNVESGRGVDQREIDHMLALEYWLYDRTYNLADLFGPELAVSDSPFVPREGEGKIDWQEGA